MIKEYICKRSKVSEAIEEISTFITMIQKFNEKYNNKYSYSINITELNNTAKKWTVNLKLIKNEK